ncbi:glutamine amidotransferase [Nocardiopsis terrae]|uniref:Protease I n=1 Tax=Nocardiopsis terrae TaxID=372655 RepID=A0ABR9HH28_9ACTN|nr:type 1 glutamine amidotransferase domain-containing protein [Nocardiopsis terrae]MBE1458329.1 protease I [Nocardiopsis terrae]GHC81100.1 glutamine amidotransferase [Nocardiopsis terrae]
MADALTGRRVAVLAADGVEQVELVQPRQALVDQGADVELVSLHDGRIQAMNGDIEPADQFTVDREVSKVGVDDYDALVVPGGTVNPDNLRSDGDAVRFVRDFVARGKPVAAICHGPWILVEADVVRGRTLTSYPSIRTDIRNAGGVVVEEEVVTDHGLTTSRNPDDLPAFCERIVREFAG